MPLIPNLGDQFNYKDGIIAGDECVLITPKDLGVKWDNTNKHYRSSIVRKSDGHVVSRGFGKFCNVGEAPDFEPWNAEWEFDARKKIDGSLLIISRYKGELITRTRGTFAAQNLENGNEIEELIKKYPLVFNNAALDTEKVSILCEWITPSRRIVIRESEEPKLILLGIVSHEDGKLTFQKNLDLLGKFWKIDRPERFHYALMAECLDDVKEWKDKEGLVLYHEATQTLKKCKALEYLRLHRLKSHISSISNLVDFYMTTEKSADYNSFFKVIEQSLDFELALQAKNDIEKVTYAHQVINVEITKVEWVVDGIKHLPRKDFAAKILDKYSDWRKSYSFMVVDGKTMPDKMLSDLILNSCKNDNV